MKRYICKKEAPWKEEYGRAIHPDAEVIYSYDRFYYWEDGYDRYLCPHCGFKFKVISDFPITEQNQTRCLIHPYTGIIEIIFNEIEIELIQGELDKRNFNSTYPKLEVLLHEIAHVKQYRKAMRSKKWFKVSNYLKNRKNNTQKHEDIADRYAHYCLRRIMKC